MLTGKPVTDPLYVSEDIDNRVQYGLSAHAPLYASKAFVYDLVI